MDCPMDANDIPMVGVVLTGTTHIDHLHYMIVGSQTQDLMINKHSR